MSKLINLHPDVAQMCQGWWNGQNDPLYAVISRFNAGLTVWDKSGTRLLIEASDEEIEAIKKAAQQEVDRTDFFCENEKRCANNICNECLGMQAALDLLNEDEYPDGSYGLACIGEGPED